MKGYKVVITVLILYLCLMLIIFLPGYIRNRKDNLYIISGNFVKIKYEQGKWDNVTDSKDYRLKKFKLYEDNKYKGIYKIIYNNQFHLYDEKGKVVDYSGRLFGYRGSIPLNIIDSTINENYIDISEQDQTIIKKALSEKKVESYNDFNLFQKISIDVDDDGTKENIYSVSNYFASEVKDKAFSIIFIEKNNELTFIQDKVISSDKIYFEPYYEIQMIIDIKNNNKYEVLITKNYFSQPEKECALLYNLYDKKSQIADLCK